MKNNVIMIEDFEKISSYDYIEWEKLRDRTIFVTGATGLIGKLLVKTVIYVSSEKGSILK